MTTNCQRRTPNLGTALNGRPGPVAIRRHARRRRTAIKFFLCATYRFHCGKTVENASACESIERAARMRTYMAVSHNALALCQLDDLIQRSSDEHDRQASHQRAVSIVTLAVRTRLRGFDSSLQSAKRPSSLYAHVEYLAIRGHVPSGVPCKQLPGEVREVRARHSS